VDNRMAKREGLQVTTFGELHRTSEAKKNILSTPTLAQVLDSVKFETQELPDDLQEALLACQRTKELIMGTYKQQLNNYLEGNRGSPGDARLSSVPNTRNATFFDMYKNSMALVKDKSKTEVVESKEEQQDRKGKQTMLLEQASKYETMLNTCLIERMTEETRFAAIRRLKGILWLKSEATYAQNFDKQMIQQLLAEAESTASKDSSVQNTFNLNSLIDNFWVAMEQRFMSDFLGHNLVELFH